MKESRLMYALEEQTRPDEVGQSSPTSRGLHSVPGNHRSCCLAHQHYYSRLDADIDHTCMQEKSVVFDLSHVIDTSFSLSRSTATSRILRLEPAFTMPRNRKSYLQRSNYCSEYRKPTESSID